MREEAKIAFLSSSSHYGTNRANCDMCKLLVYFWQLEPTDRLNNLLFVFHITLISPRVSVLIFGFYFHFVSFSFS